MIFILTRIARRPSIDDSPRLIRYKEMTINDLEKYRDVSGVHAAA